MKPSAQLLYTYQRAREQALEECRLRQEAVYARFPRLREITEARKALTYQLGRSLLAQEDPQSTRKAYAANMQALLREGKGPIKGKQHPPRLPGACMAVRRMPGYRLRYRRRRGQAHVRLPDPADVGRAIYPGPGLPSGTV